jgi:hypothetical protein
MIRDFRPDIVQYWMGRAGQFSVRGAHKNIAWYGGYYNRAKYFKDCHHHIVLTEDLRRHVIASGAQAEDVSVIRTYAEFAKTVMPEDRTAHHTPADAPLLLALARLHPKKGLDIALRALVDLPTAYLWIAGDGPLRTELEALATSLGVAERVRFLGWRNDRERLLAACDICVFPSRYEPFGTVTVDAWAAGKPIVAAASAGPAATITDGVDGLLVPIDNVGALRDALSRVINDRTLSANLVAGGTNRYHADYTKAVLIRNSMTLYGRLI